MHPERQPIQTRPQRHTGRTLPTVSNWSLSPFQKICKMTPRFSIGDCAGGHRADNRVKNRNVLCVPRESHPDLTWPGFIISPNNIPLPRIMRRLEKAHEGRSHFCTVTTGVEAGYLAQGNSNFVCGVLRVGFPLSTWVFFAPMQTREDCPVPYARSPSDALYLNLYTFCMN